MPAVEEAAQNQLEERAEWAELVAEALVLILHHIQRRARPVLEEAEAVRHILVFITTAATAGQE
jgi:hypothetical protein